MSDMKIAAGYLRCSTDLQENSTAQQRKEIEKFAQLNGYRVEEWFEDFGQSGTTFDQRPEFQRMRRIVDNGPNFAYVICYDASRWGRAVESDENTFWTVYFRRCGVQVVFVKSAYDVNTPFAPVIASLESYRSSEDSRTKAENVLRGLKDNGIYTRGGPPPYGYNRVAVNLLTGQQRDLEPGHSRVPREEKVIWVPGDPEEVKIVRFIFEERAKERSFGEITEELNRRQVPCYGYLGGLGNAHQWSKTAVRNVVKNDTYWGARRYLKISRSPYTAKARGVRKKPHCKDVSIALDRSEWQIIPNAHEAIVTKELFDKANSVDCKPANMRGRRRDSYFLASGMMKCSWCGYNYMGFTTSSHGYEYQYYRDSGHWNYKVCKSDQIRREFVESAILTAIQDTFNESDFGSRLTESILAVLESVPKLKNSELKTTKGKIERCNVRKERLLDAIENGGRNTSLVDRLKKVEEELHKLETSLIDLQNQQAHRIDPSRVASLARDFISNFKDRIDKIPTAEKQLLVRKCIHSIFIDRDTRTIHISVRRIPNVDAGFEGLLKKAMAPVDLTGADGGSIHEEAFLEKVVVAKIPASGTRHLDGIVPEPPDRVTTSIQMNPTSSGSPEVVAAM